MTPTADITILATTMAVAGVGTLFALHHLRVQPARRPTATLLFWKQAARPQSTRVPWSRRFTHRKTFALLASILLLLAAALTADRWDTSADRHRDVVVIDDGAATAAEIASGRTLLADLVASARADLHRLPGAALISAGPRPLLLARTGTPAAVTGQLIDVLIPQPGASAASQALLMAGGVLGDRAGNIHWYTDEAELPAGLPADVASRVVVHAAAAPKAVTIAGITFTAAEDDPLHGTLHVRLVGSRAAMGELTLDVATAGQPTLARTVTLNDSRADVAVDGIPADGRVLRLNLGNAPGTSAAHHAEYRLPDRRPLTFRFATNVPTPLKLALKATGTEVADGTIYVGIAGAPVPQGTAAAILVVNGNAGVTAGEPLKLADAAVLHGLDVEGAVAGTGPALTTEGTALLTAANGTVVASFAPNTNGPTLMLSQSIVGPSADLPKHAAFPVLLGRLCHALVGRGGAVTAIAAGRAADDPLWIGPPDAPPVSVTPIADPPSQELTARTATAIELARAPWNWTEIVLGLAMILLAVDASLRAARKIV